MQTTKKYSVSVGIPAHNEANNIEFLLRSILSQKGENFWIEKIYVLCDGCTDKTAQIATKVAKEDQRIVVFNDKQKKGKSTRLNELYFHNQSDLVLNLDGDILLDGDHFIEELVSAFARDSKAFVVAAHLEPICPPGFIGRVSYINCKLWDETRLNLNGGDHISNLFGAATMVTRDLSKSFVFPTHITCDEEFLYIIAKKQESFRYCFRAKAYYLPASNLLELRSQATRFSRERFMLESYFGADIVYLHDVPFTAKMYAIQKLFRKDPFFTFCAILFNFAIHYLPSIDHLNGKGMWEQATSTKSPVKFIHHSTQ